tara:strand:- start:228 stop:488 length:261 start_codon:yes stop_codon:yes gene_type:complete
MAKKEEVQQENVVNIGGKGYKDADLNQQQKYLIAQLKDLGVKAGKLRADLDQVQRASDSFQRDLLESFREVVDKNTEVAEETAEAS